jgi:hypothetical protein
MPNLPVPQAQVPLFPQHLVQPAGEYGRLSHKFYLNFLRTASPNVRVLDQQAARIDLRTNTVHIGDGFESAFDDLGALPALVACLVEVQSKQATQLVAVFIQVRGFTHARLFEPVGRSTANANVQRALRTMFQNSASPFLRDLLFADNVTRCFSEAFADLQAAVFTGLPGLVPDACAAFFAWVPVVAANNPGFGWTQAAEFAAAHRGDLAPRIHDLARHMFKAQQETGV